MGLGKHQTPVINHLTTNTSCLRRYMRSHANCNCLPITGKSSASGWWGAILIPSTMPTLGCC